MRKELNFLATGAFLAAASIGLTQQISFTQITNGAIINDLGSYTRAIWGDFNNDGLLDLFVSNYDNHGSNVFYWGNGGGTFTKLTQGDPVQDAAEHTGAAGADYDNDGYLDLVVSAGGGSSNARRNLLYHNNADGTFSRVSGGVVTNQLGYFDACTWADYDNDGFIDLFVTNNGLNDSGGQNLLFHNEGDGTFSKVTASPITTDVGVGYGAVWADYDNDGFMDLLVVNLQNNSRSFLYHNNGNRSFTRILTNTIATDAWPGGAQAAAWGDYDNDGRLDLFVTDSNGTRNRLYHNNGNGAFTNVAPAIAPMVTGPGGGSACGAVWGDYDNDGYLDLFVTYAYGPSNAIYHNNGDGSFTQVLTGAPVNFSTSQFACFSPTWADYDNDGFLDLFITRYPNAGTISNLLYHNDGNNNAWLKVKLVGTVSNRSAVGAKVRVQATIGGKTFWQLRQIDTGGGWNVVPLVAHFGLGDATKVDTLRIEWPSGAVQEFQNVTPKQTLTITEPPRLLAGSTNGVPQFLLKGGRNLQYDIQASTNLQTWVTIDTMIITNLNGTVQIADTNAPTAGGRFYRALLH